MATIEQGKQELLNRLGDLTTLRDSIRVDLHLAGMDLRDQWTNLERTLLSVDQPLNPLESATREALEALIEELRRFGERLREGAKPSLR
jgi:hypothetical protein